MGYHKFTDNDVEHAANAKSLSRLAQFKNITNKLTKNLTFFI